MLTANKHNSQLERFMPAINVLCFIKRIVYKLHSSYSYSIIFIHSFMIKIMSLTAKYVYNKEGDSTQKKKTMT